MVKRQNPVNPWIIAAGVLGAGTLAYFVFRKPKKQLPSSSTDGEEAPKIKKAVISKKAIEKTIEKQDEETIKNDPFGYTSFFTKQSEDIILSDLEAWKIDHNVQGSCTPIPYTDAEGDGFIAYFKQARDATRDVLQKRYSDQKWNYRELPGSTQEPLPPLPDTAADWQQWLFNRVYALAAQTVCDYVPPST